MSENELLEAARQDFIDKHNGDGQLSLFAVYLFYNNRGYNVNNLSFESFCDFFIISLQQDVIDSQTNMMVPLVNVYKIYYILSLYFNVEIKVNEIDNSFILC